MILYLLPSIKEQINEISLVINKKIDKDPGLKEEYYLSTLNEKKKELYNDFVEYYIKQAKKYEWTNFI